MLTTSSTTPTPIATKSLFSKGLFIYHVLFLSFPNPRSSMALEMVSIRFRLVRISGRRIFTEFFSRAKKCSFFSKLYAPCLLSLADAVVVTLNVWNVSKRNRHRITHFIGNSNTVQASSKLTWVRCRNKQDRNRQRNKNISEKYSPYKTAALQSDHTARTGGKAHVWCHTASFPG